MNTNSNQNMTNASDSDSTLHRKRRHMYTWHSEWCGHYDLEDRPIYLPRLTEQQIREIAESAGIRFRKSRGLSVFCPSHELHLEPDRVNDCQLVERFGIPRLTCSDMGCDIEKVRDVNARMVSTVLWDLICGQSNRLDELEEERLESSL